MTDDQQPAQSPPVPTRHRAGLIALLAADTISALGNKISLIAIPWLVLVTTDDPAKMGIVVVAEVLPYVAAGVLATPLADRFGMRPTSIATDLGSAVAMAAVAAVPQLHFPLLVLLVAVSGGCRGLGDRAKHVLLRPMADAAGARIIRVAAGYDGLTRTASLVGAPVGGLLVFWLGAQGAIWFDAVSFGACAVLVFTLVRPPKPERTDAEDREERRQPYLAALLAGLRFLVRDRLLLAGHASVFLINAFAQASIAVFIPLWVAKVFGNPTALGVVLGGFSVGAVLGNILFTALAPKLPRYRTFLIAVALSGVPRLLVLGLSDELSVVLVVTFLSGISIAAINPTLAAMCWERIPTELQARGFGLLNAIAYLGLPFGGMLGGLAASGLPLSPAILFTSGLCLVLSALSLAWFLRVVTTAPRGRARSGRRHASAPAGDPHGTD